MGGDNFNNQTGEDVIRVMDMRVPLHDKRVTALVANGMKCFSFSDHINLIARPPSQQPVTGGGRGRSFSDGPNQDEAQQAQGAVPGNDVD